VPVPVADLVFHALADVEQPRAIPRERKVLAHLRVNVSGRDPKHGRVAVELTSSSFSAPIVLRSSAMRAMRRNASSTACAASR
jgi:hypothetical protein